MSEPLIDVGSLLDADAPNLREIVAAEVTTFMLEQLGIDLPLERRIRIAQELDYWVGLGAGGAWGFAQALSLELAMYGDPSSTSDEEPRGILNNPRL